MIKHIIFDFGDVFINLDKSGALENALRIFNLPGFTSEMLDTNINYEIGAISSKEFIDYYKFTFPNVSETDILNAWNCILKDFPQYRFKFLKELASKHNYNLFLLSNTNELHIDWIKEHVDFYEEFKSIFKGFYLSHEIGMRKPDANSFNFIIKTHQLLPEDCLFIDDTKENTDSARKLGIHTWNIDETQEDVVDLFKRNNQLF